MDNYSLFLYYHIVMEPFKYSSARGWLVSGRHLWIRTVAYRMTRGGTSDAPQGRLHHLILLFYDPVYIRTSGRTREWPPNTLLICEPGAPARFGSDEGEWTHTWMHCGGQFVTQLFRSNRVPVNEPITLDAPRSMERCVLDLYTEFTGNHRPDRVIVENTLTTFAREVRRQARRRVLHDAGIPRRFLAVRNYIGEHYSRPLKLEQLARMAALSPPYFGAMFKHYFRISPIELAIQLRMEEAAYQLGDANLNITEVARAVGYEDIYYFSKLFKRRHGMGPLAYRKARYGSDTKRKKGSRNEREFVPANHAN